MPVEVPEIEKIGEDCSNAKLIETVQSLPELWDKDHERFKSSIKGSYWKVMAGNPTGGPLLKKRWDKLAKAYSNERKRYIASGSGGKSAVPLFPEYAMLSFLDKVLDDSGKRIDSIMAADSSKSGEDVSNLDDYDIDGEEPATKSAAAPLLDRNPLKRRRKQPVDTELDGLISKLDQLVEKECGSTDTPALFPQKDMDVHHVVPCEKIWGRPFLLIAYPEF